MSTFLHALANTLDVLGDLPGLGGTTKIAGAAAAVPAPSPTDAVLRASLAALSPDALTKIAEDPELSKTLEPWLPQAPSISLGSAVKHGATETPTTDAERLAAAERHFETTVLAATNS